MVGLTSAAGVVGYLSEPDHELQIYALRQLNEQIDSLWTEIVDSIGEIEALYEDPSFPERELAALVAAKVYYNLQEYNESMGFALGAGKLFNIDQEGEFEDTIISKCVDTYIALSGSVPSPNTKQPPSQLTTAFPPTANGASSTSASLTSPTTPFSQSTLPSRSLLSRQDSISNQDQSAHVDGETAIPGALPSSVTLQSGFQQQLQAVIDQLFERCFRDGRYRQVVGIAVEARKLDVLRKTILRASEDEKRDKKPLATKAPRGEELLEYLLEICMDIVQERSLRNEVRHGCDSARGLGKCTDQGNIAFAAYSRPPDRNSDPRLLFDWQMHSLFESARHGSRNTDPTCRKERRKVSSQSLPDRLRPLRQQHSRISEKG